MKYIAYCTLLILASTHIYTKKAAEEIITKEYILKDGGTLVLENPRGNIAIKPRKGLEAVTITVTKQAPTQEQLANMRIAVEQSSPTRLSVRTALNQEAVQGSTDYELLVPSTAQLELLTYNGSIEVFDMHGKITAKTTQGKISLKNTHAYVHACAEQNGSILVNNARGNVKATTNKGDITIVAPGKNVDATSSKGTINLFYNEPPLNTKLSLKAPAGNIAVHLPKKTSALIQAKTDRGEIECKHELTLQPRTTQLNADTWKTMKKEVKATLGSAKGTPTAQMELYARNGIQILEREATKEIYHVA